MALEIQDQIYLLTGILGGLILILYALVIFLFVYIWRIGRKDDVERENKNIRHDNYAYSNPGLFPEEELSRRGFSMYDGSTMPASKLKSTRDEAYGVENRPSPMPDYDYRRQEGEVRDRQNSRDASKDFSSILNNDNIVFGGESSRNPKSNLKPKPNNSNNPNNFPPPPMPPYNPSITYNTKNPHEAKTYFNDRALNKRY